MIFEANYVYDSSTHTPYFETVDNASDISAAFTAGNNVIVKLNFNESENTSPGTWGIWGDQYIMMTAYMASHTNPYGSSGYALVPEFFGFIELYGVPTHDNPRPGAIDFIIGANVTQNGKLQFEIYID